MPLWVYEISPLYLALLMFMAIELISLAGLFLVRWFVLPHLHLHDGVNDAISGTVQAIGVFYGITVGLIAIGVWTTHSNAADSVSREAAAIGALYRDSSGYPSPQRERLQAGVRDYTHAVIEQAWPEQRKGRILDVGTQILNQYQKDLFTFKPADASEAALHVEALRAYSLLINERRLRIDAVTGQLSTVMWCVIWVGAALSIGVAYLYRLEDAKVHALLVVLMAGFLAMVIFMIVINDRPFMGRNGIAPDSYQLVLDKLIELPN